ncbi:hypothetical protein N0V90_000856 [Kalmusia sp. IMI 367209]|nr:hypothetical protein N0V90_000856 [Kalmusia sp. IMI 367209]
MALPTDLPIRPFASVADFESFLEHEHATASGVYLKLAKKGSGIPSISSTEAVEVALCFGWIDGRAQTIDETWWISRYTPRRPKSIWSQKNVSTIARLMKEGKMRPAGIAAVDAAKSDGRWERAYAGPSTMTVAPDLANSLNAEPAALAYFEGLNKSDRYSVLWKVETASPAVRAQRIKMLIETLAVGKLPGSPGPSTQRPKQKVGPRNKPNRDKRDVKKEAVKSSRSKKEESSKDDIVSIQPRREGLRRRM